jgi:hypothetical protein
VLAGFESVTGVVVTGVVFMALPMALGQWGYSPQPLLLGGFALLVGVLMGLRGLGGVFRTFVSWVRRTVAAEGARRAAAGRGGSRVIRRPTRRSDPARFPRS